MRKPVSLRENYSFNFVVSILNIVYPLVILAYASRVVGPDSLGRYFFALSLSTFFLLLAGMGIPIYGARAVARVRDDPLKLKTVFSELFLLNAVFSVFSFLVFACIVAWIPVMRQQAALLAVSGSIVFLNILSSDYLFMGLENFRNIALRNFAARIVGIIAMFMFVKGPADLIWVASIPVLVAFVSNTSGLASALSQVGMRIKGLDLRRHFRPLVFISGILAATAIYTNLDSILLGLLTDDREVGFYNSGIRISRVGTAIVTSLGMVLIPRLTHYLNTGMNREFSQLSRKSMDLTFFLGFPAMIFLCLGASQIVEIAFGPEFKEAAIILRVTSPLILITGITYCLGLQILFPNGEEKLLFLAALAAAAVNMAMNLILIPGHGAVGAAWAMLATESAILLIQASFAWKRYSLGELLERRMVWYLVATGLMALPFLVEFTQEIPPILSFALSSVIGIVLYLGCLYMAKVPLVLDVLKTLRLRKP